MVEEEGGDKMEREETSERKEDDEKSGMREQLCSQREANIDARDGI